MKMLLEKIEKYWSTRTEGYSEVNQDVYKRQEGIRQAEHSAGWKLTCSQSLSSSP